MTSVGRVWVPRNGIEDRRNAIGSRPLFSQWLESIVTAFALRACLLRKPAACPI
jgi:hypothetical protein